MPDTPDLEKVFERLKSLLRAYEPQLVVTRDEPHHYSLNTPYVDKFGKQLFFGAVQIKKHYVSFYLMPVYVFPDLLLGMSSYLKKRMQGKSCFNFTAVSSEHLAELSMLTESGFGRFKREKLV